MKNFVVFNFLELNYVNNAEQPLKLEVNPMDYIQL